MTEDLLKLLNFFHLCEKLKTEKRYGKTSDHEQDRVASHSWRMSVIMMLIYPLLSKKFDLLKALKMAIIHDLPEVITGDSPYFQHAFDREKRSLKDKEERKAMLAICDSLPEICKSELQEIWAEYVTQSSFESKMIKAIDKIEAQIQHNEAHISVWNDYDRAHYESYLDKFCCFDEVLFLLKNLVQAESKEKLEKSDGNDTSFAIEK